MKIVDQKAHRPLGKAGSRLWREILSSHSLGDAASRETLLIACEAVDRAEMLAALIEKDGAVIRSENRPPRDHPALKHELANRAFVTRQLRELGLLSSQLRAGPGRPTLTDRLYAI